MEGLSNTIKVRPDEADTDTNNDKQKTVDKPLPVAGSLKSKIGVSGLIIIGIGIALVSLLIAIYSIPRQEAGAQTPVFYKVKTGNFINSLRESGELRALKSITIAAQKDLPIIYLVAEGTNVKKGDVVVRFDASKYELEVDQSNAALNVAEADLHQAEKHVEAESNKMLAELDRYNVEVRLAQLQLDELKKKPLKEEAEQATLELERAKLAFDNAKKKRSILPEFVEKGIIEKSTLEEAELDFLETKATLNVAQFNYDKVLAGPTKYELDTVEIRLEQAKFALEKAQKGLESQIESLKASVKRAKANVVWTKSMLDKAQKKLQVKEIQAPRDGLVVYARSADDKASVKIQLGMIPFEGQPLLFLPDVSIMVVDTQVNEIDVGKIEVGGEVEVKLEAFPDAIFHGKVYKIGSLAKFKKSGSTTSSGIKVFDVTIKITEKDPRLKPGLTAGLNLIFDRQKDIVSVPLSAVISREKKHLVFVADGGKIKERTIVLGPSNERSVIVQEGLRDGEEVVLNPRYSGTP